MDEDLVQGGNLRRVQVQGASSQRRFTPSRRKVFLETLALTCNVHKAAAAAGIGVSSAYRARLRDPVLADQWRAALDAGYDRLEALMLEYGGAGVAIDDDGGAATEAAAAGDADIPPFDFDRAMRLLQFYRSQREGKPSTRSGRPRRNATREETNAALIKALTAARKRLAKRPAELEPGA